jgi:hypothetical protein
MNCLRSLERWDHGFQSHSRHGCLCVRLFFVCVVLCIGSGLATGLSLVQGVYRLCKKWLRNWRRDQGPVRAVRAIRKKNRICWNSYISWLHLTNHCHRLTAFTALLGDIFHLWVFLCSRAHVLAGRRPSHINLLTLLTSSQDYPVMAAGPRYIGSARMIAQKTPLPTVTPLLRVTQPLPSNVCFSGSAVHTLSKYATVYCGLLG